MFNMFILNYFNRTKNNIEIYNGIDTGDVEVVLCFITVACILNLIKHVLK